MAIANLLAKYGLVKKNSNLSGEVQKAVATAIG
jgi:hypothetical protein